MDVVILGKFISIYIYLVTICKYISYCFNVTSKTITSGKALLITKLAAQKTVAMTVSNEQVA